MTLSLDGAKSQFEQLQQEFSPQNIARAEAVAKDLQTILTVFLAGLGDQVEVGSLEEIIALNNEDLANRAPYGQGYLLGAQNSPLSEEEYLAMKENNQSVTRDGLSKLFADYDIDVLLSDVGQAYAPAGFPAMTVPTGYADDGQPMGVIMISDYLGEPNLIAVGFALEQSAKARKAPDLEATMKQIEALVAD